MNARTQGPILFDFLSDGVVVVSRHAEIRYANAAARAYGVWQTGVLLGPPALREALERVVTGKALPPARVEIVLDDGRRITATLVESSKGGDLFVALSPVAQESAPDIRLASFMTLLRAELGPALESLVADTDAARALGRRLGQLGSLAEAHLDGAIVESDRIDIKLLAGDALAASAEHAESRGVRVAMSGFDAQLPPIYGSRRWLLRALVECLCHAIDHGTRGACVEVRAAQHGTFVRIVVLDHGFNVPPYLRAALVRGRDAKRPAESAPQAPHIGLAVCERVLELHGGHFRIESGDGGRANVMLELPTGAPAQAPIASGIEQAWRYAEDLARLMAERHASSGASPATAAPARSAR